MRNLKKLLALVLTLALSLSLAAPAFAAPIGDYPDGAAAESALAKYGKLAGEYERAAQMLIDLGVVTGGDGNLLNLDGKFSRGQFVVMLYQCMHGGLRIADVEPNWQVRYSVGRFNDTKGHWAEGEIAWAAANGFVVGVGDGNFAPLREITFNNGVMLIMNSLGYDAVKEGVQNLNGTWVVDYANARDVYLRDFLRSNIANNLVALDVDTMQLSRAEAFYLFWNFLNAAPFDYGYTLGSYAQTQGRDWDWESRWIWKSFQAISGEFMIVSDGRYFGLPEINNIVGANNGINIGNFAHDGGNKAIIQRPVSWDRQSGDVDAWQNFILSADDTNALGITLDKVGHKFLLTFQDPAVNWETGGWSFGTVIGEYNRHEIRQIYGGVENVQWLSESKLVDTVPTGVPTGNAWDTDPTLGSRVFVDYDNDLRARNQTAGRRFFSTVGGATDNVDKEIFDTYRNWDNNDNTYILPLAGKKIPNADIRVVETNGKAEFVFIEYYVISAFDRVDNGNLRFGHWSKPKYREFNGTVINENPDFNLGDNINNYRFAERKGLGEIGSYTASGADLAGGDYVALSRMGRDDNGAKIANGWTSWAATRFLLQRVTDQVTGEVTNVRYDADGYVGGVLADYGTGGGLLTLDSKNYNMSSSGASQFKAFNTFDNKTTGTFVLWHGEIIDTLRGGIASTYCVIEAAGAYASGTHSTVTSSSVLRADIVLGDGTIRRDLVIDRIFALNSGKTGHTQAARSTNNTTLTAAGTFSAHEGPASGGFLSNNPVWFKGNSDIFGATNGARLEGHIFRYTLNGDTITLYEVNAAVGATEGYERGNNGVVSATTGGRFNQSWGAPLKNTLGMNNTTGSILTTNSQVVVSTMQNSNIRYNAYKTAVPGYTLQGQELYTETLFGAESGNLSTSGANGWGAGGSFVRFSYVNAKGVIASSIQNTHWAVVVETGWDNVSGTNYTNSTIKALISGGEQILTSIDYTYQGINIFSQLRRGDVFIYDSEDSSPDKIFNIRPVRSDALVSGMTGSTVYAYFNVVNNAGAALLTEEGLWGTEGNNYILGANWANNGEDGPINNSALRDKIGGSIDTSNVYNLYVFKHGTTNNYSNGTEILLVRKNINNSLDEGSGIQVRYNSVGDRRDSDGRIDDAKTDIKTMDITKVANNSISLTDLQKFIYNQIKAIADRYGVKMDIDWDDITINNYASLAAGGASASIPEISLSFQEYDDVDVTDAQTKNIPNAGGMALLDEILMAMAPPVKAPSMGDLDVSDPVINADGDLEIEVSGEAEPINGDEYPDNNTDFGATLLTDEGLILIGFDLKALLETAGVTGAFQILQKNAALEIFYNDVDDGTIAEVATDDWRKSKNYANLEAAQDKDDGTFFVSVGDGTGDVIIEIYTGGMASNNGGSAGTITGPAVFRTRIVIKNTVTILL